MGLVHLLLLGDSLARPDLFRFGRFRQYSNINHSGRPSVQGGPIDSTVTQPESQTRSPVEPPPQLGLGLDSKRALMVAGLGCARIPRDLGPSGLGQVRIASWAGPVCTREKGEDEDEVGVDGDEGEVEIDWRGVDDGGDGESRVASPSPSAGFDRIWMKKGRGEDVEEESDISELRNQLAAAASAGGEGGGNTRGTSMLSPKWKGKAKPRFHSLLSVVDGEGQLVEEEIEEESESEESDDEGVEEEGEEDINDEEEESRRRRTLLFDSKR